MGHLFKITNRDLGQGCACYISRSTHREFAVMAKSIRSKWKRKMRDVKRDRYAKKEDVKSKSPAAAEMDVEMEGGSSNKTKKSFGKTDKNGQYPVWMSQRNVKRLQKKNGKKKLQKKKSKSK